MSDDNRVLMIVRDDSRFQDYVRVLLPCMAPVPDPAITMPDHILPLITGARDRNLPITAMRGSVRELGRSGGSRTLRLHRARVTPGRARSGTSDHRGA